MVLCKQVLCSEYIVLFTLADCEQILLASKMRANKAFRSVSNVYEQFHGDCSNAGESQGAVTPPWPHFASDAPNLEKALAQDFHSNRLKRPDGFRTQAAARSLAANIKKPLVKMSLIAQ